MSKLAIVSILCALCGPVLAQSESVTVSGTRQGIALPDTAVKVWPEQLNDIKGKYDLSNDATLTISSRGGKIYAEVGAERSEIVASAPNRFVAVDRKMAMQFTPDWNGTDVRLTLIVPAQVSLGKPERTLVLMARR